MDQGANQIFFALLRSAIRGTGLTEEERGNYSPEVLEALLKASSMHDVAHLLVLGLKKNGLIQKENADLEKHIFKAVYRHEQIKYEYEALCEALEKAEIPFLPLKGAVLREYYPEAWMRTSCDVDVLVHGEDLEKAVSCLVREGGYVEKERTTHDISLFTPSGVHVEIHFDLVEEGRANDAIDILRSVWENALLRKDCKYWHEMSDAFFYFYHIAHMAKHFENGGCGIRPFIDLWILDHMENVDVPARDELLSRGKLLEFARVSRQLSEVWLGGKEPSDLSLQMQSFLLHGGVYGSTDNRVALWQKKKGGRFGYVLSRIFAPYSKLARYYPVLEKHRWLMPVMQVRRWLMLLDPRVAKMAANEMKYNANISDAEATGTQDFLNNIGL